MQKLGSKRDITDPDKTIRQAQDEQYRLEGTLGKKNCEQYVTEEMRRENATIKAKNEILSAECPFSKISSYFTIKRLASAICRKSPKSISLRA